MDSKIPYWAVGNEELKNLPPVKDGDEILCDKCNGRHILNSCTETGTGKKTNLILTYECSGNVYIGAVAGKLVAHSKVGSGGTI